MERLKATAILLLFWTSCSIGQTPIRMPPTITKHPRKIIYFRGEGDAITLECQANGTPNITYKWEKNGVDLDQGSLPNTEGRIDGTITIERATSLDEGYYQCFATNQYGTALSIVSYAARGVLRLLTTPDVTTVTVREGEPFHILYATVKSSPKPIYGWEVAIGTSDRSSTPVTLSNRVQLADNGDLYFAYAKSEDDLGGKLYKCTAYNPYLDIKTGGYYTRVIVTRVPGGAVNSAPTLGFSSESQVVGLVSGSVNLRCFFKGKPEPTIFWNRSGNRLYKESTDLFISNITASDEGNYTCTARNVAGQASYTLQLSIETEPSFKTTNDLPHNVNVIEGDTVTFNCKADAKPKADVVWFRNGETITDEDAPTRYVISPDKKSLTINHICLNCPDRDTGTDMAVIQCNASNRHGYAFASGYLNVFEKTQIEVENDKFVTVDIDNGNVEVELKCSAKYDPTTPIKWTWFKHQFYGNTSKIERIEGYLQTDISINGGSLKIRIDVDNSTVAPLLLEAWRKYFGRYICVADNGISRSNRTIELQQFLPDTSKAVATVSFDDVLTCRSCFRICLFLLIAISAL